MREGEDCIPREWLRDETSLERVQGELQATNDGFQTEWREFLAQMQLGDQLHDFLSPPETWQLMAGRAGYAIVRDGKVVDAFITILS
jgi:hypothetical protein